MSEISTNASIDRLERNARWYGDYRSRLFVTVLTASFATLTFYFGVAASSLNPGVVGVRNMLPYYMLCGNVMVLLVEMVLIYKQRSAIYSGMKAEKDLGSGVNSFACLESGFVFDLRFSAGYFAGIVLSTVVIARAQHLI